MDLINNVRESGNVLKNVTPQEKKRLLAFKASADAHDVALKMVTQLRDVQVFDHRRIP